MMSKFTGVSVEKDTHIIAQLEAVLGPYDVLYQKWSWDGIVAESIVFANDDVKSLDEKALNIVKGSKIWIVDGCGYNNPDNKVHADLEKLYRYNEFIKADKVYITSLSSLMDYKTLEKELPDGFYPAYDGLSFEIKQKNI